MKKHIAYLLIGIGFFLCTTRVQAQDNSQGIRGIIVNQQQEPQSDVTVIVAENPTYKAVSDVGGTFVVPGRIGQHLLIKQAGKLFKRVAIDQDSMQITIATKKIHIGYDVTRDKDELTAAVSTIWADDLTELGSSFINPRNMLYGKLPGLIVTSSPSAGLAPAPNFLVRGPETSKSTSPMIMVDGFRWDFLRSLTPAAIKSVSVLKDAAALALYGQRGGNGVILITTKHGGIHPLRVNASVSQTITQPLGLPDMVDGPTYAKALNEARENDGLSPRYGNKEIQYFESGKYPYLYPDVNWFKEALRSFGLQTNATVTFDGGGNIIRYFALLNYAHFSGIFRRPTGKDKYQGYRTRNYKPQKLYGQLNFRSNLDINLTKNTLLKFKASAFLYDMHYPRDPGGLIGTIYRVPSSAFPIRLPDGTWGGTQIYENPRAQVTSVGTSHPNARQFTVNAILQQNLDALAKGLNFKLGLQYYDYGSFYQYYKKTYKYGFLTPVFDNDGNVIDTTTTKYSDNSDLAYSHNFGVQHQNHRIYGQLNYARFFGDNKLDAMVLAEQNAYNHSGVNTTIHYRKLAANVHYGINRTYFFDVAAAYAGRSLLAKGHRFTFYPAVSAAWMLSNESFLADASFLNRLKLRASWGRTGMDNITHSMPYEYGYVYAFDYHAVQLTDNYSHVASFGLEALPTPANQFNTALSEKINFGIDARVLDHLSFMINLYHGKRSRVVLSTGGKYSDILGITAPQISSGIFENKGLETELRWENNAGKVQWYLDGQFAYTKNKIVNENEIYRPYDYMKRTGRPIGQIFGLKATGLFKDQQDIDNSPRQEFGPVQPGDIKYKDQNQDGVVNEFDVVPLGYAGSYPQIYYSASLGLHYKGFGFAVLFQGTGKQTAYLNTSSVYWPLRNNNNISEYYYKHRWTPQTASTATLPRLSTLDVANNYRTSSLWLKDRSYLALRFAKLSYSLPSSLVQRVKMDDVEIVLSGRNLFFLSDIPVGMPEYYGTGYPMLRYYTLGINVQF